MTAIRSKRGERDAPAEVADAIAALVGDAQMLHITCRDGSTAGSPTATVRITVSSPGAENRVNIYQVLAARPTADGPSGMPPTRTESLTATTEQRPDQAVDHTEPWNVHSYPVTAQAASQATATT